MSREKDTKIIKKRRRYTKILIFQRLIVLKNYLYCENCGVQPNVSGGVPKSLYDAKPKTKQLKLSIIINKVSEIQTTGPFDGSVFLRIS